MQAREQYVEANVRYFLPTNSLFQYIYSSRVIYGAEYDCQIWKPISGWVGVDYYTSSGHSLGLSNPTHIYFIPVILGLKYSFDLNWGSFYFGAGAVGTYVHIRDHSAFVIPTSSKWTFGGLGKGGFLIDLPKSIFLDLFAVWMSTHVNFYNTDHGEVTRHTGLLNNWSFGGGIGYKFGAACPAEQNCASP